MMMGSLEAQRGVIEKSTNEENGQRAHNIMLEPELVPQVEPVRDHDSWAGAEDRHATSSVWE